MRRALGVLPYGAALALAYAVKRHYSEADVDDLELALMPTAWLVAKLTGAEFFVREGVGYLSPELRLAIVPGCAGLNFMVVVFLALVFGFLDRFPRLTHRVAFFAASVASAYAVTIVVNAWRIVASHRAFVILEASWPVTFDEVHRVVGVALYVTTLLAIVALVERLPFARERAG
jgi:exosortase K